MNRNYVTVKIKFMSSFIHKKNHDILLLVKVMISLMILYGCQKQPNYKYEHDNPGGKLGVSAMDFIKSNDSLSMLAEAIDAAGLQDLYSGSEMHTYIAPTNQAFRNYLSTNKYASIADIPVPILKNILLYHVVNDKVVFSDSTFNQRNNPVAFETENGQWMYLSRNNNYQGVINEGTNKSWTITISNLEPTNGSLHIVTDMVYFSAITGSPSTPTTPLASDTIYAIEDAFINGGGLSTTNYGADPLLRSKNVDNVGEYDRKIYLMFDLNDINTMGQLRKASVEMGVSFTAAKGLRLYLYDVANTDWNEMSINWSNAPKANNTPIASIVTSKVAEFKWDCTDFISSQLQGPKKIALMMDADAGGDETNDLISKENPANNPPRLVTTFSSGNSNLAMGTNKGLTVAKGGVKVLNSDMLKMEGAAHEDIIYKLESAPSKGWLITGSTILTPGSVFTQLDLDVNNIVYVHAGNDMVGDKFTVSVSDPDGGEIAPFDFNITVQ